MLGLKIPIAALIYIVWWAVKDPPEPVPAPDDRGGDGNDRVEQPRHPRKPFPRHPRRGPHGGLAAPPPARIRTTRARARTFEH
jgi:hypothetical protein